MRPVAIGLSPNLESDDVVLSLKILFSPWKWTRGENIKRVENWFRRYFNTDYVFTFDSGRSAQYCLLKSLGIGEGDEVLIQAFTCVAVPNSIAWLGAKPIYLDIEKNGFNLDPKDFERKVTEKSKAVIVQHTFGITADTKAITKIAQKYRLFIIEDCAQALGSRYKGKIVGTFGDGAFFSFGRDKIISSVFGGAAIVKNKKVAERLGKIGKELDFPTPFWIFQQLFHPVASAVILPLYDRLNIGKIILATLQKLFLLSKPVDKRELMGDRPPFHPRRLPNGLAVLAFKQLKKLTRFNDHRRIIADIYSREKLPFTYPEVGGGDVFLRFPVMAKSSIHKKAIVEGLKKRRILIGDWYSNVIDPKGVDIQRIGYRRGSCVNAERVARLALNLPTYPTFSESEAKRLIEILKEI